MRYFLIVFLSLLCFSLVYSQSTVSNPEDLGTTFNQNMEEPVVTATVTPLDADPNGVPSPPPPSTEAFGDLLQQFDLFAITGKTSHLGVGFLDGHYWVTSSEAGVPPNYLHKIDESGTLVQSYSQPTTGWGWRDLADDGTYLYGSVTPAVEQIDPATGQPTGVQIMGPENPNRALTYVPATDHFWTVNFGGSLYEFDRNGNIVNQFANPISSYGLAYDTYTTGGPWLWLNAGTSTGDTHHMDQCDPTTGTLTGLSITGTTDKIAGGLDITTDISTFAGLAVMVAIGQTDVMTVWELAPYGDPTDPNPPANATAYSDYTMPTSMDLAWDDPTTLLNGTPINPSDFTIEIERDGTPVGSVPGGTEMFTDTGLNDGQSYEYGLYAKLTANDSTSSTVTVSWTAGGAHKPMPPGAFSVSSAGGGDLMAHWTNPTDNIDGTPMDDFDAINLYEDGTLLTTFTRSTSDTGAVDSSSFTPGGSNLEYYVTAMDNETPANESDPSNTAFPPFSAPYLEDFETATVGTPGTLPMLWTNETGDDFDWYVDAGGTPSVSTGPTVDHTTGTSSGIYMYTEASSPNFPNMVANLTTPFIDLSGVTQPGLSFWYHMYGSTMGELHVDVYYNGAWVLDVMSPLIGQQQASQTDPWLQQLVDLSAYSSMPIQIRFRGITGSNYYSDMAIDDVYFTTLAGDPTMVVSTTAIGDTLLVGATDTKMFNIGNATAAPSVLHYTITESPAVDWLSVTPDSGSITSTANQDIAVDFDATAVSAGTHTTQLIVAGNDPVTPQVTVDVTLQANQSPVISITPDTFDVDVVSGTVLKDTLVVSNLGNGPLDFTVRNGEEIPELIYHKFNEVGATQTENFADPATAVNQFSTLMGAMSMGGTGQDGAALVGTGGSSSSDYVDTGWPLTLGSSDWTISFWINNFPTSASTTMYHFGDVNATSFRAFTGGVAGNGGLMLRGPVADVNITGITSGPHMITYVYDSSVPEIRGYLDDVLNVTVPQSALNITSTGGPFKIGGYSSSVGLAAGELMDNFKLFTRIVEPGSESRAVWLTFNPTLGTVPAGGSMDVELTFDPVGLLGGDYFDQAVVESNDPVNPQVHAGVHMFVIAQPAIAVTPDSVIYSAPTEVGAVDTMDMVVWNNGAGVLDVTGITPSNSTFSVSSSVFTVDPYDSMALEVYFAPTAPQMETGTLAIASNDPVTPTYNVYVEGEGIEAPVIGVTPDTFSVVVPSDTTITQTMTISNTGSGPLMVNLEVEAASDQGVKIDRIGISGVQDAPIIGRGRSVPLDKVRGLSTSIPTSFKVNSSGEIDKGAPSTFNPSSGLQVVDNIKGEEVFGGNQFAFGPAGLRGRGNFFSCTSSTTLLEHRLYINPTAPANMYFVVYEGDVQIGTYNLISAANLNPSATGEGWYSSGSINVPLVAGKFYLIETEWDVNTNYYNNQSITPWPIPASFGELIGASGWNWVSAYSVPPAQTQITTTSAFPVGVAYYQTIVTGAGVDWLSLDTTSATIPAGGSMDVTLTFDPAGLLGGDYYANIGINSNDPMTPRVDVGVHMYVDALSNITTNPADSMFFPDNVFVGDTVTQTLWVIDNAAGVLNVTSMTSSNPVFTMDTTHFNCPPFDSVAVQVTFAPLDTGTYTGTLSIASNDPNMPVMDVYLEGTSVEAPVIVVSPMTVSEQLAPGDSMDVPINISNVGGSDLEWNASMMAAAMRKIGVIPDVPFKPSDPSAMDASGEGSSDEPTAIRGFGDLLEQFNLATITGATSHLGIGFIDGFFWVTSSEAGAPPNYLHKIDQTGALIQSYSQPTTGWGWRDMADDGTYLYGSVTSAVEQIDPATGQPTGVQIIGPENPNRALAYVPETDHFWTVNFGGSLYEFDRSGTIINQFPNPVSSYGLAWDPYSAGGPYIWLNAGTSTGDTHHMDQCDPTTGTLTGVSITGITDKIAGGLEISGELTNYPGMAVMLAIGQTDVLSVWDLDAAAQAPFGKLLPPTSGTIAPGDNFDLMMRLYGVTARADTFMADVVIDNNTPAPTSQVTVDVTLVVVGIEGPEEVPTTFAVEQNYPNPFNPETFIKFQVPQATEVTLTIYNVLGQKVRTLVNQRMNPGYYKATWDGRNDAGRQVGTGVYVYRFVTPEYNKIMKMILMK